jgi:hypothetical protein
LETDSSDYAIGSALSQYQLDSEEKVGKVLGYYSRSLTAAEINYAIFENECLSIVASITHFHTYLACEKLFFVHTDHKSLITVLKWKTPNRRIARWISTMSEYSFETRYRSGPSNTNADALNRLPSSSVTIPDADMPTKVVCREGMWETEGQYDRSALGEKVSAFISAHLRRGISNSKSVKGRQSPVRVRNRKFQRAPLRPVAARAPLASTAAPAPSTESVTSAAFFKQRQ